MNKAICILLLVLFVASCKKDNLSSKSFLISTNAPLPFLFFDRSGNKELRYNLQKNLSEVVYDNYYIIRLNYDSQGYLKSEYFFNANIGKWDSATYIHNIDGLAIGIRHERLYDSLVYDSNNNLIKRISYLYPDTIRPDLDAKGYMQIKTYEYDSNHNAIDERIFSPSCANFDVLYPWNFIWRFQMTYDTFPNPLNLMNINGNNMTTRKLVNVIGARNDMDLIYDYDYDGYPVNSQNISIRYNNQLRLNDTIQSQYFFKYR
ncbi:MAG: hypothetical protein LLG13_15565 [Bacteroidales bacterium]|nr:hypothetical protein [Bacteroidales bacterium]